MKKGLILVLFALVSVVSYSQVSWNAKVGMNMNNITDMEDSDMKIGYTLGVGMDYAFTDMWSIQPSLMFSSKGTKVSFEEDGDKYKESYNPLYLELPVLAAAKFSISDNAKIVVNAGPYFAFGVGGKASVEETDEADYDFKLFSKEDGADEAVMNRFDVGLQYGVGLEFNKFLVNLSGQYGFTKLLKGDWEDEKGDKISPKNIGFSIAVGYKF